MLTRIAIAAAAIVFSMQAHANGEGEFTELFTLDSELLASGWTMKSDECAPTGLGPCHTVYVRGSEEKHVYTLGENRVIERVTDAPLPE
jgi:hypothetical protein